MTKEKKDIAQDLIHLDTEENQGHQYPEKERMTDTAVKDLQEREEEGHGQDLIPHFQVIENLVGHIHQPEDGVENIL